MGEGIILRAMLDRISPNRSVFFERNTECSPLTHFCHMAAARIRKADFGVYPLKMPEREGEFELGEE
jgi:hypothetical protein